MLEEEKLSCPICDTELYIKVFRRGKLNTYIVGADCPKCKTPASKLERMLSNNRKSSVRLEKSYIKLDPRG